MAYDGCPCYWLEQTGRERVQLRRFTFSVREGEGESDRLGHRNCPASDRWGHDAAVVTDIERDAVWEDFDGSGYIVHAAVPDDLHPARDDPRWPTVCAACGEPFQDGDQWQVNGLLVFTRSDTGAEHVMAHGYDPKIPGALYDGGPWMRSPEDRGRGRLRRRGRGSARRRLPERPPLGGRRPRDRRRTVGAYR